MSVELTWIGHASFRIASEQVVYIDPWKIDDAPHDGNLVIVSHDHYDHCSSQDVAKVAAEGAEIFGPGDAVDQIGQGYAALPGEQVTLADVQIEAVPAYNLAKEFHPRSNHWLGAVVTMDGKRIYYAGDTDLIDEMGKLGDVDVALLPVGGTYTMDPAEAAEACKRIGPAMAIPYHWGDIVGNVSDARAFADAAPCEVRILQPGQSTTLD